jgi:pyrroloquinoline-quinone synthase
MDLQRFAAVELLPEAAAFRAVLDDASMNQGWEVAAAVSTIFLEGTRFERGELDPTAPKRPTPALADHPLVKHYGLPIEHLTLTKAHRAVEGDHRHAAWRVMSDFVAEERRDRVVAQMERALASWSRYRTAVARACGV